jgi:formylglycine-generating enzyme required for sulfatase activity
MKKLALFYPFLFFLSIYFFEFPVETRVPVLKSPKNGLGKQVYIKSGNYYVGAHNHKTNPLRSMVFKDFYIDIHPVTNSQYLNFIKTSQYHPQGDFDTEKAKQFPLLPATGLTYQDAEAYARYYQKRLPTEWEWEIAARSLKKEVPTENKSIPVSQRGNFFTGHNKSVMPVFSYPPNELGIFGMAGNVFEWTSSVYPKEYLLGKYHRQYTVMVLRGGAWTNLVFDVKVSTRTPFAASRQLNWIGFRCVSDQKTRSGI